MKRFGLNRLGAAYSALALAALPGLALADEPVAEAPPAAGAADAASTTDCKKQLCVRDLFAGVGLAVTHKLGGRRTEAATAIPLGGGGVFVQIAESEDTDIRAMFETHYLMRNQTVFGHDGDIGEILPALAACGPFALIRLPENFRRGCGPFFAVAVESDVQVSEFGLGWFMGFGEPTENGERNDGFGVGFGLVIDPDSRTIDGRVVDTDTMMVRPAFEAAVQAGEVSLTTQESTVGFMLMISKDF